VVYMGVENSLQAAPESFPLYKTANCRCAGLQAAALVHVRLYIAPGRLGLTAARYLNAARRAIPGN
jgi:hypothetical protein